MSGLKIRRNIISMLISAVVYAFSSNPIVFQQEAHAAEWTIEGRAGVLLETQTGKTLWAKDANRKLPPASTAKILTALIVLEKAKLDDRVTVPTAAIDSSGGSANLQAGEILTVDQLLHAIMMRSANDAAIALATYVGGSVKKFTELMNQKAKELGAVQSTFKTVTGMPAPEQVSTAADLAMIAKGALQNDAFRKLVATKTYAWKSAIWQGDMRNSNLLLDIYEGALGIKTGSTAEAGYCLVTAATRNGQTFIAVVLGSQEQTIWQDAVKLLDHGFKNFASIALTEQGDRMVTSSVNGKELSLAAAEDTYHIVNPQKPDPPQMQINLNEVAPPVAKGEKLGQAVFREGDKEVARVDLVAENAIPGPRYWLWVGGIGGGVTLLGILAAVKAYRKRRRRYIFAGRGGKLRLR